MTVRLVIAALALGLAVAGPSRGAETAETTTFESPDMGTVHVFEPAGPARGAVVFLSGDGGWKSEDAASSAAAAFAEQGLLALGVDVNQPKALLAGGDNGPLDLGALLSGVARDADARYGASGPTFLGGYSAGATLAYAAFSQSPAGRFSGLLTLSFCPNKASRRPVGGPDGRTTAHRVLGLLDWTYAPAEGPGRWALVEGTRGRYCLGGAVSSFARAVPSARLWSLAGFTHSLSPREAWADQRREAVAWVLAGA